MALNLVQVIIIVNGITSLIALVHISRSSTNLGARHLSQAAKRPTKCYNPVMEADDEVTVIFMSRFKHIITANQVDNYTRLHFGVDVRSEHIKL